MCGQIGNNGVHVREAVVLVCERVKDLLELVRDMVVSTAHKTIWLNRKVATQNVTNLAVSHLASVNLLPCRKSHNVFYRTGLHGQSVLYWQEYKFKQGGEMY